MRPPRSPPAADLEAPATEGHRARDGGFPIVGIGASAGGLEALEAFLAHVPERSGIGFVVVQHLDPTHKGVMVELLQRVSNMPVVQVKENVKVEPDRVYVIPPNKDLSILRGALHLMPPVAPRGMNLPIDGFFRSLANDQQERGIGVILSGMGSDGTLGLRSIKEKAGAGFVQAPASAKFDGMPSSAIEAGLADVVAPVEELPGRILAYLSHAPHLRQPAPAPPVEKGQSAIDKVIVLLRMHTGNDFSLYKRSTVYRRVERRMGLHQIDRISNYVRYLRENPREVELLFKELLIGVTSFFRDGPAWEHLAREVMPELLAQRRSGSVIRAWVPACSTGEEAYSLAIVFKEAMARLKNPKNLILQIFATDLDRDAIDKARQGLYPANIAADVSPERLRRHFVQEERGYRVSKDVREMVIFAPQNVIMDPPFTKLDLLSCRNLLIYLAPEMQRRLVPLFHYSLNPGGILFLGSAETVGAFSSHFAALDGKTRLYRRLDAAVAMPVDFPASFPGTQPEARGAPHAESPAGAKPSPSFQALADRVLLQRFSPAGVLVNERGDIIYISGRTGKYLEPAMGKANWNVFAMARDGLRVDLGNAFSRALREERAVTVRGARFESDDGAHAVDLTVQRLDEPRELRGTVLIVFTDAHPAPAEAKGKNRPLTARQGARLAELERELQRAREEVQTTREEMQTSQEELKSTNEELQSTNEELQSTNEELTTSKEEMQSLNEELQTVNHELQAKVDELSRANNDMKNLLNSTDIATLFLDGELHVRRFTTQTAKIIKLIPGDAGRPITDLVTELQYPALPDDAREVLRTLIYKETVVASRGGRWFTVRIMPYRTIENVIDGVVITFTDASATKALETAFREQASQLRQMAESLPTLVWGARPDGACDYLSRQWVEYTGVAEADQLGSGWLEQVHPDDRERVRDAWRAAVKAGVGLDTELRLRDRQGRYRWHKTRAVPIRNEQALVVKWYGTHTEVDDLKRAEEAAQRQAGARSAGEEPVA
ncbi:chemotaxis protein CheB [Anaeromyxobacter diazotrophicus]|uniref:protein-glutamate O-methyltransferase n=1 Tax=Anaeromyxobacter diazotrophicus TaxID=2590199 RepID=A0A7I9VHH8_9BACT|nr:chemotaxis protein CheB [Anaeromyxobacter diazotrophicus]GEJ55487.1 chemotaxis protein CheR [Anaeromyxobacter diazotrophicus]